MASLHSLSRRPHPTLRAVLLAVFVPAWACSGPTHDAADAGDAAATDVTASDSMPPGVVAVPLEHTAPSSCLPLLYTAGVTLGGSGPFHLAIDTGSGTLGVAASTCSTCGVSPTYAPGASATDQHVTTRATYGDGSGWQAEVYTDTAGVGAAPAVPMRVAAITDHQRFFRYDACGRVDNVGQGVLGLGPTASAAPGADAFFDRYVAATHAADVFATGLCPTGGTLWLGGFDPGATTGDVQYTPMTTPHGEYYTVGLASVTIAGQSVPIATAAQPDAVVDTGTGYFLLGTDAFAAVRDALGANPAFVSLFVDDTGDAGADGGAGAELTQWFSTVAACMQLTQTAAELDAMLPPLTLVFSGDPAVSVELPATGSYLARYDVPPYGAVWCNALGTAPAGADLPVSAILGLSMLRSRIVVFDRANQRVGFAPRTPCP